MLMHPLVVNPTGGPPSGLSMTTVFWVSVTVGALLVVASAVKCIADRRDATAAGGQQMPWTVPALSLAVTAASAWLIHTAAF